MHFDLFNTICFEVKFYLKTYSARLFQGSVAGYSRSVRPSTRRFIISQDGQSYLLSLSFCRFLLSLFSLSSPSALFSSLSIPSSFPLSPCALSLSLLSRYSLTSLLSYFSSRSTLYSLSPVTLSVSSLSLEKKNEVRFEIHTVRLVILRIKLISH